MSKTKHTYSIEMSYPHDIKAMAVIGAFLTNNESIDLPSCLWYLVDGVRTEWEKQSEEMLGNNDTAEWVGLANGMRYLADAIEQELRERFHSEAELVEGENGEIKTVIKPADWDKEFTRLPLYDPR